MCYSLRSSQIIYYSFFIFGVNAKNDSKKNRGRKIYNLLKQVHTTLISCSKETVIFAGIVLQWLYTGRILRSGAFSVTCLINLTIAISFSGCCAFPGVSLTVLSVDELSTILPLTTGIAMMAIVTSTKTLMNIGGCWGKPILEYSNQLMHKLGATTH